MKIAIIGWGSIVTEPRELPIEGGWQADGPKLWIEFSRIAKSGVSAGCLTAVIDERCTAEVTTMYVLSQRAGLKAAIADLQAREETLAEYIGNCEVGPGRVSTYALSHHPKSCDRIRAWAKAKGFDAVVWTALARRFKDVLGIPFSPAAAMDYLNNLPAPTKEAALAYIHNAPEQTMTPFRRSLLGSQPIVQPKGMPRER